MEYATIWKNSYGFKVEWRGTFDLSKQQVATRTEQVKTRMEAKRMVKLSGAKLWN